jgi:hypothetical protein
LKPCSKREGNSSRIEILRFRLIKVKGNNFVLQYPQVGIFHIYEIKIDHDNMEEDRNKFIDLTLKPNKQILA